MRLYRSIFLLLAVSVSSCFKMEPASPADCSRRILFRNVCDSVRIDVDTKTANTTSLSSFYVTASTGSSGSETMAWNSQTFTYDNEDGCYKSEQVWPEENPSYHFRAANVPITWASDPTISVSNNKDVVKAYLATPVYGDVNNLSFTHVFGAVGNITIDFEEGFTYTNLQIYVQSAKTSGTVNIRTGSWTYGSASTLYLKNVSSVTPVDNSLSWTSDTFIVPSTYTIVFSVAFSKNGYSSSTSVSNSIQLTAGRKTHLHYYVSPIAHAVKLTATLSDWESEQKTASISSIMSVPEALSGEFSVSATKKVRFAPGNLQAEIKDGPFFQYKYTASRWFFAEHQYDYVGSQDFSPGSLVDLFSWEGAAAQYDTYGLFTGTVTSWTGASSGGTLKYDWGAVPGVLWMGSGWRTLTSSEWSYLLASRSGYSSKYGMGKVGDINGLIILPDSWSLPANCTFTSGNSAWSNVYTLAASGSSNAWCDMEAAGAVFLPAAGSRSGVTVGSANLYGYYWSSTGSSTTNASYYYFYSNYKGTSNSAGYFGLSVRLVKDVN